MRRTIRADLGRPIVFFGLSFGLIAWPYCLVLLFGLVVGLDAGTIPGNFGCHINPGCSARGSDAALESGVCSAGA